MAKQVISFGKPPMGIGGDTYKSALIKCNENFDELFSGFETRNTDTSVADSSFFRNVDGIYRATASVKGALVIHVPKSAHRSTTMVLFKLCGYNYANNTGAWEVDVSGYNYTTAWLSTSANLSGAAPFNRVRLAQAADHQVLILGDTTTVWAYPSVRLTEVLASYGTKHARYGSGYTFTFEENLDAYTGFVEPALYGVNRAKAAEALLTARMIGGKSFDGTANIDLPGVNIQGNQDSTGRVLTEMSNGVTTASLGATTATAWNNSGRVTAKITNSNNALTVHVGGASNERKVMIQAGHASTSYANVFGEIQLNPLGGAVKVNGSPVLTAASGQAVSAAKLADAREIAIGEASKSFDGSGNLSYTIKEILPNATSGQFLKYDGSNWVAAADNNSTYAGMTSAEISAGSATAERLISPVNLKVAIQTWSPAPPTFSGTTAAGLVPARSGTTTTKYLREDGTWTAPPNNTYSNMSAAEISAGTATTGRLITPKDLKTAVVTHAPVGGQFLGNQATKAIAYNAKNISENVTIPGDVNALSAGPIAIDNGKTVTVSDGATWTIV